MKYNPEKHHRKSIRLKNYDYSSNGGYFITMCVENRKRIFGEIKNGEMILSEIGKIVKSEWEKTGELRKNVIIDEFVIMPDHFHGIIFIFNDNENNDSLNIRTDNFDDNQRGRANVEMTEGAYRIRPTNENNDSLNIRTDNFDDNDNTEQKGRMQYTQTNEKNDSLNIRTDNFDHNQKVRSNVEQTVGAYRIRPSLNDDFNNNDKDHFNDNDNTDQKGRMQYAKTGKRDNSKPNKLKSPKNNLGSMIRGFKSSSTSKINELMKGNIKYAPLWQRNYYESIIKNEIHLENVRNYIYQNPLKWEVDSKNPSKKQ